MRDFVWILMPVFAVTSHYAVSYFAVSRFLGV